MAIDGPPAVAAEPRVRPGAPGRAGLLLPAAVAMFTEEVGVSPLRVDGGAGYRARVAELVRCRASRWPGSRTAQVLFKAEIGAVSRAACQVQGVWVAPAHRGRGIGHRGHGGRGRVRAHRHRAGGQPLRQRLQQPRARAAYRRVGFREVGQYASVLF